LGEEDSTVEIGGEVRDKFLLTRGENRFSTLRPPRPTNMVLLFLSRLLRTVSLADPSRNDRSNETGSINRGVCQGISVVA
jgi:hypothetical protein